MNLHFAKNLQRFGEQTALLLPDGTAISYLKLAQLADHFAQRFVQFDVWPQQVCALLCRNNLTTVVAYLCCLRHQRPLVLLDANLPQSQLDPLIRQLEIAVLIDDLGTMRRVSASAFRARPDLALLLSTSGSTGDPKSVMLSLDNLHSNALAISRYLPLQMSDVAITALPLHYSYGLSVLNSHLLCGATVLLTDYSVMNKEFWQLMRDFAVNSLAGVPFSYKMLKTLRFERLPLPALRYMTQAGGPLSDDLRQYVQLLAEQKQIPVYLMYGQTEATARIAWLRPEYLADHADCIGEPIPGGALLLRDVESRTEITEANLEGELVYQGPNVMLGYAQNSADLRSNDKMAELATGDLAILRPNGLFQITGRLKRMLKIQGKRWQLDQLETLLQRERWSTVCTGRDDLLVVAVIDANAESTAAAAVSDYLHTTLLLHPSLFKVLLVRDVPYTNNGKVHYHALLRIATGETLTEGPGGSTH
ncbi:AMP-binding protein [Rheinheimera tilapiae]|jgi:long-chain acyl-CoA synthetase|uniref:AMP-binding protein n=1 Tax=Rheinheimera tilapiae TaxID=875043 RepID=A0ABV6BIK1_9GAMM